MSEPDDLTAEEEQVRRLLADARHTAPLPDDVAARLDAVLADLRDEDPATPAPVVATQRPIDLAAARRRRNVRTWLVAAAAVVAVGFGINQVTQLDVTSSDSDSASSADGANAEAGGGDRPGQRDQASEKPSAPGAAAAQDGGVLAPVRLDPDRFGTQVSRLRVRFGLVRTAESTVPSTANNFDAPSDGVMSLDGGFSAYAATCPTIGWGRGNAVAVRYDHQPGVLVFRPVRGDTQVVDLFLCGSDDPERSITLPAP